MDGTHGGVPRTPRRRQVALVALIFLVGATGVVTLVVRQLSFAWPTHGGKRATAEMSILRSDPALNSAPPGATVVDRGEHDDCLDPSFDARPPTIWRDYRYAGSVDDWFRYFNGRLPARGWVRTADFTSAGHRALNFTRRYETFDAQLIVSEGEVMAEITRPNFC